MAGNRFDVYLSSTKADLEEERALVISIIQSEFNRTVKHSYSASDQPALESCLADVRSASLYLCIIGRRYGSCPTGHTKSYTHHEFEEARRTGKPIFVFLKAYDALYADDQRDPDGCCADIEEFRRIANETARPAVFDSLDALRTALGVARTDMDSRLRAAATSLQHPPADAVRRKLAEDKVFLALPASLPERWARIEEEIRLQRRGAATAGVLQLLDELWSDTVTWELADDGAPLPTQAINQLTRLIYTTNAIESLNSQLRKIIKTRGHFPSDEAATKLIWLALRNITAEHGRSVREWREVMKQLAIAYGERFSPVAA